MDGNSTRTTDAFAGEARELRLSFDTLSRGTDTDLERYGQWRSPVPPGLYWKARWLAGTVLRALESAGLRSPQRWPVALKQSPWGVSARPLLLWGMGMEQLVLREACDAVRTASQSLHELAPVLVTDVADFAYFSRLGWLVEFVPSLSGEKGVYSQRKLRYLARLYSGALLVPLSVLGPEGLDFPVALDLARKATESAGRGGVSG